MNSRPSAAKAASANIVARQGLDSQDFSTWRSVAAG